MLMLILTLLFYAMLDAKLFVPVFTLSTRHTNKDILSNQTMSEAMEFFLVGVISIGILM